MVGVVVAEGVVRLLEVLLLCLLADAVVAGRSFSIHTHNPHL